MDPECSCSTKSQVVVSNKQKELSIEKIDEVKPEACLKPIDESQTLGADEVVSYEIVKNLEGKVQTAEITKKEFQEYVNNEKNFTNEEIHEKLKTVDPVMASRLHPNNRRKVLR